LLSTWGIKKNEVAPVQREQTKMNARVMKREVKLANKKIRERVRQRGLICWRKGG